MTDLISFAKANLRGQPRSELRFCRYSVARSSARHLPRMGEAAVAPMKPEGEAKADDARRREYMVYFAAWGNKSNTTAAITNNREEPAEVYAGLA